MKDRISFLFDFNKSFKTCLLVGYCITYSFAFLEFLNHLFGHFKLADTVGCSFDLVVFAVELYGQLNILVKLRSGVGHFSSVFFAFLELFSNLFSQFQGTLAFGVDLDLVGLAFELDGYGLLFHVLAEVDTDLGFALVCELDIYRLFDLMSLDCYWNDSLFFGFFDISGLLAAIICFTVKVLETLLSTYPAVTVYFPGAREGLIVATPLASVKTE